MDSKQDNRRSTETERRLEGGEAAAAAAPTVAAKELHPAFYIAWVHPGTGRRQDLYADYCLYVQSMDRPVLIRHHLQQVGTAYCQIRCASHHTHRPVAMFTNTHPDRISAVLDNMAHAVRRGGDTGSCQVHHRLGLET